MQISDELHTIVIKRLFNHFLVERGWSVGETVACVVSEWHGGLTFDRGMSVFTSKADAEKEIKIRKSKFVGVEFEVISYKKI